MTAILMRMAGRGIVLTALSILSVLVGAGPPDPAAAATDKLDRGPKIGEPIPHRLDAVDQHGKAVRFSTLAGRKGLILLFTRSLDW